LKWVISTLVVGISWIITIVLWVQDKKRQKSRIEVLETKNGALEIQVATLNGQVSGVNQAAKIFMENPPSLNNYRIELLEKRVDFIENRN
jgi:cell division protein FtsB